ncbi:phage tail protein [Thiomicrorhabdus sp.]|uniref:phage tail protein n=1 Tax=Thiomicrorhabdus sp. TaxID=2039724 RepID=UPI0029C60E21|nr:phage tail protein [Thiomicrorhabdus sp.]
MNFNIDTFVKNEQAAFSAVSSKLPIAQRNALNLAINNIKKQKVTPPSKVAENLAHQLPAGQSTALNGQLPIGGTLLQLGDFQFASGRANLESLERSTDYRWSQQDRLSREVSQQWTGQGSDKITLNGLVVSIYQQDTDSLAQLRTMAANGKPYRLTSGFGKIYGLWVVNSIKHTSTALDNAGRSGWIEFSLQLSAYGEDA